MTMGLRAFYWALVVVAIVWFVMTLKPAAAQDEIRGPQCTKITQRSDRLVRLSCNVHRFYCDHHRDGLDKLVHIKDVRFVASRQRIARKEGHMDHYCRLATCSCAEATARRLMPLPPFPDASWSRTAGLDDEEVETPRLSGSR